MKQVNNFLLVFLFSLGLASCNSSSDSEYCFTSDNSIECDGGYSYWINDITSVSNGVVAISGVKDHKRSSQQWVSFFSDDLSKKLAEIPFARNFYADEHNAPAVLALNNGNWLIVRTGHNDTFENNQGRLYVYSVDNKFEISNEVRLSTKNGATYAQLVETNGFVHLLTRDSHKGWGYFVSYDQGVTWGDWQPLWPDKGHRYISMQKFNSLQSSDEQVIFNIGHHPTDKIQNIGYLIGKNSIDGKSLVTNGDNQIDHAKAKSEVEFSLSQQSDLASNIRFLDAKNESDNVCHLYSTLNSADNSWQLNATGHNIAQETTHNFDLGRYFGVLGESTYVNGASIGHCRLDEGEQLEVFVAHQEQGSQDFLISRVYVDVQSGDILNVEEVVRSEKQLYRPVYIRELNYLMFNEAEYWRTYERWQALQKVIKL